MAFDTKGKKISGDEAKTKSSRSGIFKAMRLRNHACSGQLEELNSSTNDKAVITNYASRSDYDEDSNWPHFTDDENYIIFCFRGDGSFDVLKNGKIGIDEMTESSLDLTSRSARSVNRKLNYEENTKTVVIEKSLSNDGHCIKSDQKGKEENIQLEAEVFFSGNFEEHRSVKSAVSSDSTESSKASSGSFAFPALGWEWIGSPEKMPKSEGLRFRKHKARRFVAFQCCRF